MTYAVIDLETTGLKPQEDRITEIGCLITKDDGSWSVESVLVNPHRTISEEIIGITGITNEMVQEDGLEIKSALDWLCEMIKDCDIIVGHNIFNFDHPFLMQRAKAIGHAPTLQILKIDKLRDTAAWFKGIKLGDFPKQGERPAKYASRIMDIRARGVRYNLQVACNELGLESADVDRHRAYGDIVLTHRVYMELKDTFEKLEQPA